MQALEKLREGRRAERERERETKRDSNQRSSSLRTGGKNGRYRCYQNLEYSRRGPTELGSRPLRDCSYLRSMEEIT